MSSFARNSTRFTQANEVYDRANPSSNSHHQKRSMFVLLLVLGRDIEMNPDPIKYLCKICEKPVAKTRRAVMCDRPVPTVGIHKMWRY